MATVPTEDGLQIVSEDDGEQVAGDDRFSEGGTAALADSATDSELESLRDEFVDAFNARDLDSVLVLADQDVECPDFPGDGLTGLSDELQAIWERSPSAILTRAFLDEVPCAVAWLPDEEACWSRAALVCFDGEDGLLTVVALPDDPDGLDRAEVEEPTGEELDEWSDWAEWDRGEETVPGGRA